MRATWHAKAREMRDAGMRPFEIAPLFGVTPQRVSTVVGARPATRYLSLEQEIAPCPKCGAERHLVKGGIFNGKVRFRPSCNSCERERIPTTNLERKRALAAEYRKKAGGSAAYNKRWKSRNQEKARAHKIVETRLRYGKLSKQPCERCGATDLVHAHHDDYSKPLEVMWLCPLHHKERHRELQFREAAE